MIDKTVESVQRICQELRPALLDDLGLIPAIEWTVQEFQQKSHIKFKFQNKNGDLEDLDSAIALCLFRIIQEGLTNIIRHSNASEVLITLKKNLSGNKIILIIKDNGRGIKKLDIENPNSLGLLGMRERLIPFKAKLIIKGLEGRGTALGVSIPLDPDKHPDSMEWIESIFD
jgi:two-component system sensor histidine kinase UhpB